ncbi:hypothetical protein MKW94_019837 [Papaver nudicaule]|uniref:Uncharacterized protein n=1 Tax=Papaver nudicaule TaxID=74823 RepID=A0AA41RWM5_PAPNU|nr:hypothetical protein [Papaver nudicaule]
MSVRDWATTVEYPIGHKLAGRINGEDGGAGMTECWSALYELQSCTNEIILFFTDGEMYLGFTSEDGDILKSYCDAPHSAPPRSSPVTMLPPAQTPALSPSPFSEPSTPLQGA